MYSPDVQYNYVIDGRSYKGSNVAFGSGGVSSSNSSSAYGVVNKYNKGHKVNVYYNPNEPHNSVLEPGANWASYAVFAVGLLFLVIGILIIGSSILKIIFGTAIIIGAIGGLIGKKPKSSSNTPNNTNDLMTGTKSKANSDDDGFDVT